MNTQGLCDFLNIIKQGLKNVPRGRRTKERSKEVYHPFGNILPLSFYLVPISLTTFSYSPTAKSDLNLCNRRCYSHNLAFRLLEKLYYLHSLLCRIICFPGAEHLITKSPVAHSAFPPGITYWGVIFEEVTTTATAVPIVV